MAGPINPLRNIQDVYDWFQNWDERGDVVQRGLPMAEPLPSDLLIDLPTDHPTLSMARAWNAGVQGVDAAKQMAGGVVNSLLPVGKYEDGSYGPAWPQAINALREDVNVLDNYARDLSENGQRPITEREAGASFGVAGSAPMGTAMLGGIADNAVGVFGGRLAKTADHAALAKAEELAADERRARPPWLDYDVPEADQIVRYANPREAALPTAAVNALKDDAAKGIIAYHGSPHTFDKFDMSKIGTGEGAAAYGQGLYFVDDPAMAERYREALLGYNNRLAREDPDSMRSVIEGRGRTYKVRIGLTPDELLDLDVPYSQQSAFVKDRLPPFDNSQKIAELQARVDAGEGGYGLRSMLGFLKDQDRGAGYYPRLRRGLDENVVDELRAKGIRGARYTDEIVDGVGDGAKNNYVIFDDSVLSVLDAYANPREAALPTSLLSSMDEQDDPITRLLRTY